MDAPPRDKARFLSQYPEGEYRPYGSLVAAWQEITRWIGVRVGGRERVLEIGAGPCVFINNFPAREKHAVDLWEGVRRHAAKDVRVQIRSCTDLGCYPDDSFDLVMAGHVLEHLTIEDALRCIAEVRRVLATGGLFVIVQPNFKYAYRSFYDDWTHRTPFTERGLAKILTLNGLQPTTIMARFFLGSGRKSQLTWLPPLVYRLYLSLPIRPFATQMLIIAEKKEKITYDDR